MNEDDLLKRLSCLLPSLFEQVIHDARIPKEHLPSGSASQMQRAIAVLDHVKQQRRLERLARILENIGGERDNWSTSIRRTRIYGTVAIIVVFILVIALVFLKSRHDIDARRDTDIRPDANVRPDAEIKLDADVRSDTNVRHDVDIRHDATSALCGAYDSLHAHAMGDEAVVMASDAEPLRYPDDGRIADFGNGQGAEARTVFNQQISLLSDSAWRSGRSKAWYERIDENGKDGPGILRFSFELSSRDPKAPRYVGIYFDFSFPPPVSYDVSKFHKLALSLKKSNATIEVEVRIVLFSSNICNSSYAFPTYIVPKEDLLDRWREIKVKFEDFIDPPWYPNHRLRLNPKRVYRVAIVVVSPNKDVKGYIDLDDLRFVE